MASTAGPKRFPIYLRYAALVASLAAVIAFGYTQNLHDREVVLVADLGNHLIAPVTGTIEYALIWTLIITAIEQSHPTPLHPGIYVAFDLIAWLAPTITMIIYLVAHAPYYQAKAMDIIPVVGTTPIAMGSRSRMSSALRLQWGSWLCMFAIHFAYFVWGCVATHKFRKSQRVFGESAKTAA
ncbi:hypothetical protein BJX70DRAFT_396953 [Aspergillus crustosus]